MDASLSANLFRKDYSKHLLFPVEVKRAKSGDTFFVNVERSRDGRHFYVTYRHRGHARRFAREKKALYRINVRFK